MNNLVPSFRRTTVRKDNARLYVAIDSDDFYFNRYLKVIQSVGTVVIVNKTLLNGRIPFNEITQRAQDDGAEYIVRVNDDTEFVTNNWVQIAKDALRKMDPPNVGVVAPVCNQGNMAIFTHDMVHRTHLEIFKTYYPSEFKNWYTDDWITLVYRPNNSKKLNNWIVRHHMVSPRYKIERHSPQEVKAKVDTGKVLISNYLNVVKNLAMLFNDSDIITEDDFQNQVCDFSFRTRRNNNLNHGTQVKPSSIICAMGEQLTLRVFFSTIVPFIKYKFTLLTMEHDDSIPPDSKMLDSPKLQAWFGWNIAFTHPKLYAIPIGLNKGRHLSNIIAVRQNVPPKNGRVLVNFKLDREERRVLWKKSKIWDGQVDRLPYDQSNGIILKNVIGLVTDNNYYKTLSQYTYVVCPKGLGIDTHRVWEALYLGVIPIVLSSSISSLYNELPVIQLKSWDEFSMERLRNTTYFFGNKLRLGTWVNQIKNVHRQLNLNNPKEISDNVIIAAAMNYGIQDFHNFVIPLRKVYDGNVVLFVEHTLQKDVISFCKEYDINTKTLPYETHIGVKGNRYIGYADVCSNYKWCFATDFRDVFFQQNPFKSIPLNCDLILAEEYLPVTIKSCPHNRKWIKSCWGAVFLEKIGKRTPICSGTIMGTPTGFHALKVAMLTEMASSSKIITCTARDQGHLNYLYFSQKLPTLTCIQPRGKGIVNTVGYITPRASIKKYFTPAGLISNDDGSPSAVVHQYDRFPELIKLQQRLINHGLSFNVLAPQLTTESIKVLENDIIRNDLIIQAETKFLFETGTNCRLYKENTPCPQLATVLIANNCICDWLKKRVQFKCAVVLLMLGNENFGLLDPSPTIHYPLFNTGYQGCTNWESDKRRFKGLLDLSTVYAVFYRQTPPIKHNKLDIIPLGPTRQFMTALRKKHFNTTLSRSILYYVNHSPWRHRKEIFNIVNHNFNGTLKNDGCSKTYGCTTHVNNITTYMESLFKSKFVESPPGMGEDCYRHYEAMLSGAIPVIQQSLSYPVFANLPHLAVGNWSQVTPELLQRYTYQKTSLERLTKTYWINKIRDARKAPKYIA